MRELADEYSRHPENKESAYLLAQAHLGMAHFELFSFVDAVMRTQSPSDQIDLAVTPQCDSSAMSKLEGYDLRCLMYRIMAHLPEAGNADFVQAEQILQQAFPVAKSTPMEVNFLIACVELGTALIDARTILDRQTIANLKYLRLDQPYGQSEAEFKPIVHNIKGFLRGMSEGFTRARYSYQKVNRIVVSVNGKPLIKIGHKTLAFSDQVDVPELLHFIASSIPDDAREIDDQFGNQLEALFPDFANKLPRPLREQLNPIQPGVHILWKVDEALEQALNLVADMQSAKTRANLLEALWRFPPKIIKAFIAAAGEAYEQETLQPFTPYLSEFEGQWSQFAELSRAWTSWGVALSPDDQHSITQFLEALKQSDPKFRAPPAEMDGVLWANWGNDMVGSVGYSFQSWLAGNGVSGSAPAVPSLDQRSAQVGQKLVSDTLDWIRTNF